MMLFDETVLRGLLPFVVPERDAFLLYVLKEDPKRCDEFLRRYEFRVHDYDRGTMIDFPEKVDGMYPLLLRVGGKLFTFVRAPKEVMRIQAISFLREAYAFVENNAGDLRRLIPNDNAYSSEFRSKPPYSIPYGAIPSVPSRSVLEDLLKCRIRPWYQES